jgi:uncharacterized membrane protein
VPSDSSKRSRFAAEAWRASSRHVVAVVLLVCSVSLLAGFVLKLCPVDVRELCYSDLTSFFHSRGSHMPFPYVHGGIQGDRWLPGFMEYPVVTGLFAWVTARPAWSPRSFLAVSAVFLAPLALLVAYLLACMSGPRALLFAAAPALVLYAFHNWDLLAVAPTVGALWCWWRGRPGWAAVLFALGACAKVYPAIFVAPLAFEALFLGDRRGAAVRLSAGAATALLINLPFMLINPVGWISTYRWLSLRPPNVDSIWGLKPSWSFAAASWSIPTLNLVTTSLILTSFVIVFILGWRRAVRDGRYPFLQVCGAALAAFLLWNKLHSPQALLWMLPFFALSRCSVLWWAAYVILDGMLYFSVFYLGSASLDLASPFLQLSVFGRAMLLAALIVVFLESGAVVETGLVRKTDSSQ